MRQLVKYALPVGLIAVTRKTREALARRRIERDRQKRITKYFYEHQVRKLQIGSSTNVLEGWLNTDLLPNTEEIMFLDATDRFPFEDFTFNYVFSEHMIEHIEYSKGINMLHECFRILKPGGKIRIATPDLYFLVDLYKSEKTELQSRYISWAVHTFLPHVGIHHDTFVINNFFRSWGHRFIYDFKTLNDAMSRTGYINIAHYRPSESDDQNLQGIEAHSKWIPDEFNRLETFVLEGSKPG
jgi:predicted SAM-dependent methyltransferase